MTRNYYFLRAVNNWAASQTAYSTLNYLHTLTVDHLCHYYLGLLLSAHYAVWNTAPNLVRMSINLALTAVKLIHVVKKHRQRDEMISCMQLAIDYIYPKSASALVKGQTINAKLEKSYFFVH